MIILYKMSFEELYQQIFGGNGKLIQFGFKQIKENINNEFLEIRNKLKISPPKQSDITLNLNDKRLKVEDTFTTKNRVYENKTISDTLRLIDIKGTGIIDQLFIKAPSKNFSVYWLNDNQVLYNNDFDYFDSISEDKPYISAYNADSYYYLSIRDIHFQEGFIISIIPSESITFNEISVKYKIRDEKINVA